MITTRNIAHKGNTVGPGVLGSIVGGFNNQVDSTRSLYTGNNNLTFSDGRSGFPPDGRIWKKRMMGRATGNQLVAGSSNLFLGISGGVIGNGNVVGSTQYRKEGGVVVETIGPVNNSFCSGWENQMLNRYIPKEGQNGTYAKNTVIRVTGVKLVLTPEVTEDDLTFDFYFEGEIYRGLNFSSEGDFKKVTVSLNRLSQDPSLLFTYNRDTGSMAIDSKWGVSEIILVVSDSAPKNLLDSYLVYEIIGYLGTSSRGNFISGGKNILIGGANTTLIGRENKAVNISSGAAIGEGLTLTRNYQTLVGVKNDLSDTESIFAVCWGEGPSEDWRNLLSVAIGSDSSHSRKFKVDVNKVDLLSTTGVTIKSSNTELGLGTHLDLKKVGSSNPWIRLYGSGAIQAATFIKKDPGSAESYSSNDYLTSKSDVLALVGISKSSTDPKVNFEDTVNFKKAVSFNNTVNVYRDVKQQGYGFYLKGGQVYIGKSTPSGTLGTATDADKVLPKGEISDMIDSKISTAKSTKTYIESADDIETLISTKGAGVYSLSFSKAVELGGVTIPQSSLGILTVYTDATLNVVSIDGRSFVGYRLTVNGALSGWVVRDNSKADKADSIKVGTGYYTLQTTEDQDFEGQDNVITFILED